MTNEIFLRVELVILKVERLGQIVGPAAAVAVSLSYVASDKNEARTIDLNLTAVSKTKRAFYPVLDRGNTSSFRSFTHLVTRTPP